MVWSGAEWVVAWNEVGFTWSDVRAGRISADGILRDPKGFLVAGRGDIESFGTLATSADGSVAVFYTRNASEPAYDYASRLFVRWIDLR
jgi:hypothetical protein